MAFRFPGAAAKFVWNKLTHKDYRSDIHPGEKPDIRPPAGPTFRQEVDAVRAAKAKRARKLAHAAAVAAKQEKTSVDQD